MELGLQLGVADAMSREGLVKSIFFCVELEYVVAL